MKRWARGAFALSVVLSVTSPSFAAANSPVVFAAEQVQEKAAEPMTTVTKKTLYIGGSSYRIRFSDLAEDALVKYSSSDKAIAAVTSSGVIKPVAKGKAVIMAEITQKGKIYQREIAVTVRDPYVKITNPVTLLYVGDTYQFQGKTYGLKNASTYFTVSDRKVAKIDEKTGELTAQKAGKVKITFEDKTSGKSRSLTLVIRDASGVSDEERAMTLPVKEEETGYLMYRGVYYEIAEKENLSVVDYYDLDLSELTVPDTLTYGKKTYKVTQIGEDAFSYCYDLTKIVLGNNVEIIGENAFNGCLELAQVVFGKGLKEILGHAFEDCESLEEISIPEGVTMLGEELFCGCTKLKSITLPKTLLVLGDNMFFDCNSLLEVEIPELVETIPYGLFTNCTSLARVKLPSGVLAVEAEVFWECSSLKTLTLPDRLVFLGDRAFYNSALENIVFPDKRVSIGENIFDFCEELEVIYVSENTASYYQAALGEWYDYEVVKQEDYDEK